jgi:hypothetical protein
MKRFRKNLGLLRGSPGHSITHGTTEHLPRFVFVLNCILVIQRVPRLSPCGLLQLDWHHEWNGYNSW